MNEFTTIEISAAERGRLWDYLLSAERAQQAKDVFQQVDWLYDEQGHGCRLVLSIEMREELLSHREEAAQVSAWDTSVGNELCQALTQKRVAGAKAFVDTCDAVFGRMDSNEWLEEFVAEGHTVADIATTAEAA